MNAREGREVQIVPGCIVCKTCEFHAPDVFIVHEKALSAEVLDPRPAAGRLPDVLEAIKNCPVHVIKYRRVGAPSEALQGHS